MTTLNALRPKKKMRTLPAQQTKQQASAPSHTPRPSLTQSTPSSSRVTLDDASTTDATSVSQTTPRPAAKFTPHRVNSTVAPPGHTIRSVSRIEYRQLQPTFSTSTSDPRDPKRRRIDEKGKADNPISILSDDDSDGNDSDVQIVAVVTKPKPKRREPSVISLSSDGEGDVKKERPKRDIEVVSISSDSDIEMLPSPPLNITRLSPITIPDTHPPEDYALPPSPQDVEMSPAVPEPHAHDSPPPPHTPSDREGRESVPLLHSLAEHEEPARSPLPHPRPMHEDHDSSESPNPVPDHTEFPSLDYQYSPNMFDEDDVHMTDNELPPVSDEELGKSLSPLPSDAPELRISEPPEAGTTLKSPVQLAPPEQPSQDRGVSTTLSEDQQDSEAVAQCLIPSESEDQSDRQESEVESGSEAETDNGASSPSQSSQIEADTTVTMRKAEYYMVETAVPEPAASHYESHTSIDITSTTLEPEGRTEVVVHVSSTQKQKSSLHAFPDRPASFYQDSYDAEPFPTELQDMINSMPAHCRTPQVLRAMFMAAISANTALDEPLSPDIKIENRIDDTPCPDWEFHYANKMWYGKGVPRSDPAKVQGCDCIGPCDPNSSTCTCVLRQNAFVHLAPSFEDSNGFLYNEKGCLKHDGFPVFECNANCLCSSECQNRVVQKGRQCSISLRKTKNKGWGVFAEKRILRGTFIGIYAGELLVQREAHRRGKVYNRVGRTYLFDIDAFHLKALAKSRKYFNQNDSDPSSHVLHGMNLVWPPRLPSSMENHDGNESDDADVDQETGWKLLYTVDAFHVGNFTRFLNHSCDPNCDISFVYINEHDIEKPLVVMFAARDVAAGEELCFSYFGRMDSDDEDEDEAEETLNRKKRGKKKKTKQDKAGPGDAVYAPCHCGAKRCRGRLFAS
ncbi:SET domain-containing protein [Sistotremastrum niveocremeum HHB9708]|uniref:SET domain-containing protein n=1 Tax=Sistotremastrum niveocremeum HHB9708 TaxID=1314777 RepID=A0A165A646_9AGAM|nr:SET domain-containing protein [Sistotremastrum niveocremeum HHB9708]